MATIVTRSGKGSPLTNTEVDANFNNLNTDKLELSGGAMTGAITTNSTVDGRNVSTDGTKLDTISTNADVTGTANVTAAGALMDSEITNLSQVKAFDQTGYATAAQGTKADTAHGWGNHASASYASGAQGTKADTAHGWGNHASAGYTTAAAAESSALALAIALG